MSNGSSGRVGEGARNIGPLPGSASVYRAAFPDQFMFVEQNVNQKDIFTARKRRLCFHRCLPPPRTRGRHPPPPGPEADTLPGRHTHPHPSACWDAVNMLAVTYYLTEKLQSLRFIRVFIIALETIFPDF